MTYYVFGGTLNLAQSHHGHPQAWAREGHPLEMLKSVFAANVV